MKNLKRVLSLGLASVMLAGMMVVGAGAVDYKDFTDKDEIQHTEAVSTMNLLGVIAGKDTGAFDPAGTVTRAEMAKMITVALNGGKDPVLGVKSTPTFSDIKGHWAEKYIEYCADMKYISGRGNGVFDPAGNVTGVEAAKMVLTALGYNEDAYQLKGADWAINTNAIAVRTCKPSLYENLNGVNMNVAITRDTAAQIIWNGVQNHIVEWTPNREVTGTGLNYTYTISQTVTLLNRAYDAYIWVGYFTGNDKFGNLGLAKGEIQVKGALEDADRTAANWDKPANFPAEYDIANIGEETKVIFKDGKSGRKNQPDRGDTIYGVFNTGASEVINAVSGDVAEVKSATKQVLKIDGTEYSVADTVTVVENYTGAGTSYTKDANQLTGSPSASSALSQALIGANGNTIKAIMDESGKIERIYIVKSILSVVTATSSDKVTIANVGTIKKADNEIYEDVAKDDVVVVTTLYHGTATNEAAYNIVAKAESVEGELTKYKNKQNLTVDGTDYNVYHSSLATKDTDQLLTANIKNVQSTVGDSLVGKDVEVFLVNGYVGAVRLTSTDANNYSVVLQKRTNGTIGSIFDDLKLQVMDAEGNKSIITVADDSKKLDGTTTVSGESDFDIGDIVTYDTNKDGTATVYIKGKVTTATDKATYDKDTKSVVIAAGETGAGTFVTAADCVLFVDSEETPNKYNYKAYNIRNLGDITESENYTVVKDKDGKVVAVAMRTGTPAGAGSAKVFGIVTGYAGSVRLDGTSYRQYTISVNGETYTVNQRSTAYDAADANHKLATGVIVGFEPTSDNYYENATDFKVVSHEVAQDTTTPKAVLVKEYTPDEGIITVFTGKTSTTVNGTTTYTGTGSYTYAVDDDVKMYYIDTNGNTAMASGSVNAMNTMTGYESAFLVVDNRNVVIAIIAEVSGEKAITDKN